MNPLTADQLRHGAVEDFADSLLSAALNIQIHASTSQYVRDAATELVRRLAKAGDAGVTMPLRLDLTEDRLLHEEAALQRTSLQARHILRHCGQRNIAALDFGPALRADEVERFLEMLLWSPQRSPRSQAELDRALAHHGVAAIRAVFRDHRHPAAWSPAPDEAADLALHQYQGMAEVLEQNHVRATRDQALAIDQTHGAVEQSLVRLETEPSSLLSLATMDQIDRFTVGHSVRVALLALQAATAAGADRQQLVQVGTAALLHDIGKSKVPQEVLFKQGRLNPDEWQWMAQHPRLGAQLLVEQPDLEPSAIGAAFCHHMRPCGLGYPRPPLPFQPSATSRLVRICDVFEALTSVRPYKRALTPCEAYAVMFRAEADFDQGWLRFFAHTLGIYPVGSRLVLDDGCEARVTRQGKRPHLPVVRLLTGPGGTDLTPGFPDEVTIGEPLDGVVRHVGEIVVHDRSVAVPKPVDDPQILTQVPAHHCFDPASNKQP